MSEQRCPCCHGSVERLKYTMAPDSGRVCVEPLYCGLYCDLFYDEQEKVWRSQETWEPWDGVELESA